MLSTNITLSTALQQAASVRPEQEALVCGETRLRYAQVVEQSLALANALRQAGIGKGDKIACLLPPGVEFTLLFFTVAELGAVFVPLDPRLRQQQLERVLGDCEAALLVAEASLPREELPGARALRLLLHAGTGEASLRVWIAKGAPAPPGLGTGVAPNDLLALLYTSGTTGTPKATMHSHRSLIAPVVASIRLRELWLRKPNLKRLGNSLRALARYRARLLRAAGGPQTFLSTVGWQTITGLEVMLQALLMGDRLVVLPHFHPRRALELVERERVTILVAVPMALEVMLALEDFDAYDTSSLLICGTGAAPCPPDLARRVQRRFGCAIHIGFGATETAGGIAATSLADSDERQAVTVGRAMPGVEVKIVDEQRRPLPPGHVGELACRGESVMLGYYRNPDSTAEVLDEEGWYYTGDLAVCDEAGYLRIVGRKKDVIIRGGQNIYPEEIEACLAQHPSIREAAVVGGPSPLGGEAVWAFVLLEDGARLTSQEVVEHCRSRLEVYKLPTQVRFVDDFPRSNSGKPQKHTLRAMIQREMEGAAKHG